MEQIIFKAIPTETARHYQNGGLDANGQAPEHAISDGGGVPCRHCLQEVPAGEPYLILGYRPFPDLQPYAECGPIFLCANHCDHHPDSETMPHMFQSWDKLLIRAYNAQNRIIYGTGQVTPTAKIPEVAQQLFENEDVVYIHMRSASNNCYQARIEKI